MLAIRNITKTFGKIKVLDQVSLTVPEGKIYGFLGRNGAGKTTLIRIILGLLSANEGEVVVNGKVVKYPDASALGSIGSIVEFPGFYPNLTGYENLKVFSMYYNLVESDARIREVLEIVQLEEAKQKKVSAYSLGMRQRLGLARALLKDPQILILDEPTNGLDPAGMRDLRSLLKKLSVEEGKTIFLSSHILSEVEQIVDMLGFVREGKLIEEISIQNLRAKCTRGLKIETSDPARAMQILRQLNGNAIALQAENGFVHVQSEMNAARLNRMLLQNDIEVSQLISDRQNLEDYFLGITA
jgi:bacitracin transport system ATP-binding protein